MLFVSTLSLTGLATHSDTKHNFRSGYFNSQENVDGKDRISLNVASSTEKITASLAPYFSMKVDIWELWL
jgi:hypothetical protein